VIFVLLVFVCLWDALTQLNGTTGTELGIRSASIRTSCPNTVMIEITKPTYYECFHQLRETLKHRFQHIRFLKRLYFFEDWKEQRLQHLFYPMQEQLLRRGAILVNQDQRTQGMYIVVSGCVLQYIETQHKRIEIGISGKGTLFGYEEFVNEDQGNSSSSPSSSVSNRIKLCLETCKVTSETCTVLFLPRSEFQQMNERFSGTHTKDRFIKAYRAKQRIIERKLQERIALEDNETIGHCLKSHISSSRTTTGTCQLRVATPDHVNYNARITLRLSLLPANQMHGTLKRSTYMQRVPVAPPPATPKRAGKADHRLEPHNIGNIGNIGNVGNMGTSLVLNPITNGSFGLEQSTVGMFSSTFKLNKRDQSKIFQVEKLSRSAPMPCHRHTTKGRGKVRDGVRSKQGQRRTPLPPSLFSHVTRSKYVKNKRNRWLKAAKTASKNAKNRRRKAPMLDEFDARIDRSIYSGGRLLGTVVVR